MLEKRMLSVMTFSPSSVRRTKAISCVASGNSTMETKMFLDTKSFMCPLFEPTTWPMLTEISSGFFIVIVFGVLLVERWWGGRYCPPACQLVLISKDAVNSLHRLGACADKELLVVANLGNPSVDVCL